KMKNHSIIFRMVMGRLLIRWDQRQRHVWFLDHRDASVAGRGNLRLASHGEISVAFASQALACDVDFSLKHVDEALNRAWRHNAIGAELGGVLREPRAYSRTNKHNGRSVAHGRQRR